MGFNPILWGVGVLRITLVTSLAISPKRLMLAKQNFLTFAIGNYAAFKTFWSWITYIGQSQEVLRYYKL